MVMKASSPELDLTQSVELPPQESASADMPATGEQSLGQLVQRFYQDLRQIARARMRRLSRNHTFVTTDIVHEAYLRVQRKQRDAWENRRYFFGDMARAMKDIAIERIRHKRAAKHGGGLARVEIVETLPGNSEQAMPPEQALAILAALERFRTRHPLAAEVVLLRCFGGYTMDEIATALATSTRNVERKWRLACAWLQKELAVTRS